MSGTLLASRLAFKAFLVSKAPKACLVSKAPKACLVSKALLASWTLLALLLAYTPLALETPLLVSGHEELPCPMPLLIY